MAGSEETDFDRRLVFKIPEYMPELREELAKYPQNQRAKRMLQLAYLGMMSLAGKEVTVKEPQRSSPRPKPERVKVHDDHKVEAGTPTDAHHQELNNSTPSASVAQQETDRNDGALEDGSSEIKPAVVQPEPTPATAHTSELVIDEEVAVSRIQREDSNPAPEVRRRPGAKWPTAMHS